MVRDLDGDFLGDIVTGSGTMAGAHIRAYAGARIVSDGEPPLDFTTEVFEGYLGGIYIG